MLPIKLIVGLGNPGLEYQKTRHNVGAWFIETLAALYGGNLRLESKLHGLTAKVDIGGHECRLLIPTTYMNDSGRAVQAAAKYFKFDRKNILVVHDELDLDAGVVRLKESGGHGGHNGLRDIIKSLGGNDFQRLRLGIGHPGQAKDVTDFVLKRPSRADEDLILQSIQQVMSVLPLVLAGDLQKAMTQLHS